ncbi:unnamed protein product [Vitrella brassicaformis CCMP3155]|uniref:Uncharacterized protein n=1 Tax=Vitrella brassicaformis (strain CCMP3155) TaxID=1169540 RepID=A0A0G4F1N3_VITBC|nr:unnamed protein product [Vitrella brassicaformis CCMP3155]|eukprot:CEM05808.1 unnamed protein product [Vitrella brassicaformis CCMP3155]
MFRPLVKANVVSSNRCENSLPPPVPNGVMPYEGLKAVFFPYIKMTEPIGKLTEEVEQAQTRCNEQLKADKRERQEK